MESAAHCLVSEALVQLPMCIFKNYRRGDADIEIHTAHNHSYAPSSRVTLPQRAVTADMQDKLHNLTVSASSSQTHLIFPFLPPNYSHFHYCQTPAQKSRVEEPKDLRLVVHGEEEIMVQVTVLERIRIIVGLRAVVRVFLLFRGMYLDRAQSPFWGSQ